MLRTGRQWEVSVVAWAPVYIPRNSGHAKCHVVATVIMSWYSEKPHECHRLEMNLFEVGKGILDIPHLQLRWEKSEPILGSSRETHCMSGEGSGLTFLLFSDANSKVAWGGKHLAWVRRSTHQTYCQGRGLEYPAVPCSIKTAMNNSISELFILDLCAKRMKHFISLAGGLAEPGGLQQPPHGNQQVG